MMAIILEERIHVRLQEKIARYCYILQENVHAEKKKKGPSRRSIPSPVLTPLAAFSSPILPKLLDHDCPRLW